MIGGYLYLGGQVQRGWSGKRMYVHIRYMDHAESTVNRKQGVTIELVATPERIIFFRSAGNFHSSSNFVHAF